MQIHKFENPLSPPRWFILLEKRVQEGTITQVMRIKIETNNQTMPVVQSTTDLASRTMNSKPLL